MSLEELRARIVHDIEVIRMDSAQQADICRHRANLHAKVGRIHQAVSECEDAARHQGRHDGCVSALINIRLAFTEMAAEMDPGEASGESAG